MSRNEETSRNNEEETEIVLTFPVVLMEELTSEEAAVYAQLMNIEEARKKLNAILNSMED